MEEVKEKKVWDTGVDLPSVYCEYVPQWFVNKRICFSL